MILWYCCREHYHCNCIFPRNIHPHLKGVNKKKIDNFDNNNTNTIENNSNNNNIEDDDEMIVRVYLVRPVCSSRI